MTWGIDLELSKMKIPAEKESSQTTYALRWICWNQPFRWKFQQTRNLNQQWICAWSHIGENRLVIMMISCAIYNYNTCKSYISTTLYSSWSNEHTKWVMQFFYDIDGSSLENTRYIVRIVINLYLHGESVDIQYILFVWFWLQAKWHHFWGKIMPIITMVDLLLVHALSSLGVYTHQDWWSY